MLIRFAPKGRDVVAALCRRAPAERGGYSHAGDFTLPQNIRWEQTG